MVKQLKNSTNLYAVYGTLRQGFGNHRLLNNEHCNLLGTETTEPNYKMVNLGGFPGVIPDGKESIVIEVYEVNDPSVERNLDRLEGYPSFYQKMVIPTEWGDANMYILSESRYGNLPIVDEGDWTKYRNNKQKLY